MGWPGCAPAHRQPCLGLWHPIGGTAELGVLRGCFSLPSSLLPCSRLFEYRGRVSPVPRVVPVKRPRVTIPLVRRVKATLPVKLFARSAAIANSSAKLKRERAHGVQRDGAETGVRVDLPSPGVHPRGHMLRGRNLKKKKTQNIWKQQPKPLRSLQAANAAGDGARAWLPPLQCAWTTDTRAFSGACDHPQPLPVP